MEVEDAIKQAIKGGWQIPAGWQFVRNLHDEFTVISEFSDADCDKSYPTAVIFLDPSFWQSLGKAMAWPIEKDNAGETDGDGKWHQTYTLMGWLNNWHRFIDHIADGKSAEDFFKNLT